MAPERRQKKEKEVTLKEWLDEYKEKRLNETYKTLKECEQLLKERRSKYEHLNFFSETDKRHHTRALFMGYRHEHLRLLGEVFQPGARPGFKCRFTFEDLQDEDLIGLAQFAIQYYNTRYNARLAFQDLLYFDTRSMGFGDEYLFLLAASNLSNGEIKCYRARVLIRDGEKSVLHFSHWRNDDLKAPEQTV